MEVASRKTEVINRAKLSKEQEFFRVVLLIWDNSEIIREVDQGQIMNCWETDQPGWPMTISSALFYHFLLVICVLAPLAWDHSPKSLSCFPLPLDLCTLPGVSLLLPSLLTRGAVCFFRSGLRKTSLTLQMRSVCILHLLCFLRSSHIALVFVDIYEHGHSPLFWNLKQEKGPVCFLQVYSSFMSRISGI